MSQMLLLEKFPLTLCSSTGSKDVPPPADTQKMIDNIIAQSGTASQPSRRPDVRPSQTSTPSSSQTKVQLSKIKAPIAKDGRTASDSHKNGEFDATPIKSKRPLEDTEKSTPPEKRMKVDRNLTPAQENSVSKKSNMKNLPHSPGQSPAANAHGLSTKANLSKTSIQKSPAPSKLSNSKAATDTHSKKTKEHTPQKPSVQTNNVKAKSVDSMPPLLSPLPAGLVSPEGRVETSKKQEITPPKSPKSKSVAKESSSKKANIDSPPSSPLPMPALMSPILLPWIERELSRLSALPPPTSKASPLPTAATHGVEARHERSRKPDTPGVARKTVKPKNSGAAAAAAAAASKIEENLPEKRSLIVKLKYGKRNTKNIKDLLRLRPRPTMDSHSSSSTILASGSLTSAPKPEEKKRAHPTEEKHEPPAKRAKAVASLDIQKSHTSVPAAFKSPALSTPTSSQRSNAIFGTPKKGDAMKSVAMRKVNSADDFHARTPQGAMSTPAASTPASSEKPRASGASPVPPTTEKDKAREAEAKAMFAISQKYDALGKTLKREGDALFKSGKDHPKPPPPVSESDRKLGTITHIESITSYMLSFEARDSALALKRQRNDGSHWVGMADGLIVFVERNANAYPELHALLCLLAVICREQMERHHMERLTEAPTSIDSSFGQQMKTNSKARVFLLAQYAKHHSVHDKVRFITTVSEARKLSTEVIERFARVNNIKWICRLNKDME